MRQRGILSCARWPLAVLLCLPILCALAQSPGCISPPAGLVSWWQAEGDGKDQTGANNGVLNGGVAFTGGEVGQAFSFNGTSAFVSIPASTSLNVGAGMGLTFECWIKPSDLSRGQALAEWNDGAGGVGLDFWISIPELGGVGSLFANLVDTSRGDHIFATSPNLLVLNQFQHVALTYDRASGVATLYLNGRAAASQNLGSFVPQTSYGFYLGGRPSGIGTGSFYSGLLDEPTLYNRALNASEIMAIFAAGMSGKCAGPAAPTIFAQPSSQAAFEGDTVTLSIGVAGTLPLSFQWSMNGTPLQEATNATLTLTDLTVNQSGAYAVLVSNLFGTVLSSNAVLVVSPPPPCDPIPLGLVSWWRGEGNVLDKAGANNGTLNNGGGFVPGEVGQAISLNGSSSYVAIPPAGTLDVGTRTGLTLECWIQPDDVSAPHAVAEWNNGGGGIGVHLWFSVAGFGGPGALFGNLLDTSGASHILTSVPNLVSSGHFQHVALTYDRLSGTASLFLNGAVVASQNLGIFIPQTSYGLYLGARVSGGGGNGYYSGLLDEISLYNRALAPAEIQAIFLAGNSGKCLTPTPPVIIAQPADQTVTAGDTATFTVGAGGTPPFFYQWTFGGAAIPGATDSTLTLTNVLIAQAGAYAVSVSNALGAATSSNATLVVNFPPALVQVPDTSLQGGATGTVSVSLAANGNENALGFSLNFNPSLLQFVDASLGAGAPGGSLILSTNQSAGGSIGLIVYLPSDAMFSAGTQEVAKLTFSTAAVINPATTSLTFADVPVTRQLSDTHARVLAATYASGTISIAAADFEGDVSPRPDGDKAITVTDVVLEGRYVARLDYPTNADEFQRADCAPRSTLGDGKITISDWVQVGRYAAGLDPLTVAGGPTSDQGPRIARRSETGAGVGKRVGVPRCQIRLSDITQEQGQTRTLAISLNAAGNENALGFSVSFDPGAFAYVSANLESADTTLHINAKGAHIGQLGLALALPAGKHFAPGATELVYLNFRKLASLGGTYPFVFNDQPIPRETADAEALPLDTDYLNATVTLPTSLPALSIALAQQQISLTWPLWADGFVLQQADANPTQPLAWSNVQVTPIASDGEKLVTLPLSDGAKWYRLFKP